MELYVGFILTVLVLGLIPGPNVAVIVATSLSKGRGAGLWSVFGASSGLAVQLLVVVLGMGALISFVGELLWYVRWLGVAYLSFLAVQALIEAACSENQPGDWGVDGLGDRTIDHFGAPQADELFEGVRAFVTGLVVALFNPKTFLFLTAFLPQFVLLGKTMDLQLQLTLLSALYLTVLALVDCGWVLFARRVSGYLEGSQRLVSGLRAVCLGFAAIFLALERK